MDHIVCVSEAQAEKVRRAGVREEKIVVIRNAIREGRFGEANPKYLDRLRGMFATPPDRIVGAAGRLSREKGFQVLVEAASVMLTQHEDASPMGRECAGPNPSVGFVLFGDGRLRGELEREIDARGLHGKFVLGGFSSDLDCYFPHFDLLVLPSFTEGLPNVALEAMAAGVPVVATAVGGTPEVVAHGVTGRLVPPGNPCAMARGMAEVLFCDATATMGLRGKERVREHFSFASQAAAYRRLFGRLLGSSNETSDADGQR
jgi:glycosyltransferase involved in cell wall biosynthesis